MNRVRLGMALVFLLGGLGMGASCRNNRTSGSGAAPRVEGDAEAAPSVAAPGALVTEVQGLDLAALSAAERETFWAIANDELSPCGDPHSIAVCARDRLACRRCLPALRFLARRVRDGFPREQLSDHLRQRYAASTVAADSHRGGARATAPWPRR